ncbi:MAG: UvrD-helicase domain-containing protein, partial [Alphaproteobacteria bacterium]|nr:UvrD-helicase domain-containing protein [Alphaproteobacteria bacterium]
MISDIIKIDNIKDFDFKKNTVIEASAGTGKTYTITQIVPWLLAYAGLSLGQILMVTYTEKAAGEMRARIRKKLNEIAEKLQAEAGPDAEKLRNKIEDEIEKIDDAPIFTIHSFCQKVLSENAVYSNCSQNLTLVDEGRELENFIGKYIRDNVLTDKVLWFLYQNTKTKKISVGSVLKDAIKKYYLGKNGNENLNVVSLEGVLPEEEEQYNEIVKNINNASDKDSDLIMRCFVIKNLKDIYLSWQTEKASKNQQTYTDMIKIVHDALAEEGSKLLAKLREQYKYAIIDEFQDTNQLQWNIFKQIFTDDDEHHLTIVGDPKQSIFSFQGADCKVYEIATRYIKNKGGDIKFLENNYRSSVPMINAINTLAKSGIIKELSIGYKDSLPPSDNQIQPAKLAGMDLKPVYIINEPAENDIVNKIIDYCIPGADGKTKLQIWQKDSDKNKSKYRNVSYNDFAVLVRDRKDADKLLSAMTMAGIPFMWHKDSTLFTTREAADWIALLSAIQVTDFNARNRDILRMALQTEFFDIPLDKINDSTYNDLLCHERQLLLKWRNLAENRQYAKMLETIFSDSGITKRLASYDKIQSLSKYNQIGDFILEYLVSKQGAVAAVIKMLKQLKNKDTENEVYVEKATDMPTVKISTIHSAKGLEYPVVFYFMKEKSKKSQFVRINHDEGTILSIKKDKEAQYEEDREQLRYVAITRAASLLFLVNAKFGKSYAIADPQKIVNLDSDLFEVCNATNQLPNFVAKHTVAGSEDIEPEKPGPISLSQKKLYKHSYTSLSHSKSDVVGVDEYFNDLLNERSQRIDREEAFDTKKSVFIKKYDVNSGVDICDGMYDADNLASVSVDAAGKQYGTTIHEIFEKINFVDCQEDLDNVLDTYCQNHPSARSYDRTIIKKIITNTLSANFPEIIGNHATGRMFQLSCLSPENKKSEIEFNLNPDLYGENINKKAMNNYCNGFIDLLFVREINGRKVYSVLDWKTDLFDAVDGYANYECLKAHTGDEYDIQRVLYSYCLIKWLSQFYSEQSETEIFNNHFGGIYYVYVRGCNSGTGNGIYAHTWDSYEKLENEFNNIINDIYKKESGDE